MNCLFAFLTLSKSLNQSLKQPNWVNRDWLRILNYSFFAEGNLESIRIGINKKTDPI